MRCFHPLAKVPGSGRPFGASLMPAWRTASSIDGPPYRVKRRDDGGYPRATTRRRRVIGVEKNASHWPFDTPHPAADDREIK
jgi:hypothetical protein